MLKPIEALQQYGQSIGMDAADIQRKQEKLLDALLHPTRAEHGESVVAVFAHGVEAMRLAAVKESRDRFPHWAVQTWSSTNEDWVTQKSYAMKGQETRNAAFMDARNWYPMPVQADVETKWAAINSTKDGALERLLDNRAKLAEFWYETKVIDWDRRYGGDPWPFMTDVAETLFERDGRLHPMWDEKYGEKVTTQLANFAADWGELPAAVLSGTLRRAGTNEVEVVVQYRSAGEAVDDILQSGHDAYLRAAPLGSTADDTERFIYLCERDAVLSRDQMVASLEAFMEQNKEITMVDELAASQEMQRDPIYGYYINLDERGDFYADVRNADGQTVFEFHAGVSLDEGETSIFEGGFMRNKHDTSGLTDHLRTLGVIPQDASVLSASDFEQRLDASNDDEPNL